MTGSQELDRECRTRFLAGEDPRQIVESYPAPEQRQSALAILAVLPVAQAARTRRWAIRALLLYLSLNVFGYSLTAVEMLGREGFVGALIGALGCSVAIHGIFRRRWYTLVGLPYWFGFMACGGLAAEPIVWAEDWVFVILALLVFYAIPMWLAVRVRKVMFPLMTWRGVRLPPGQGAR